jgi:hypothetical protein
MSFDLGDGTTMDTVPFVYQYPEEIVYTVTQIVSNDVGSDTTIQLITTLGPDNPSRLETLRIFPNPANEMIAIESPEPLGSMDLMASDGRLIKRINPAGTRVLINLGILDQGIYLLRFKDGRTERIEVIH